MRFAQRVNGRQIRQCEKNPGEFSGLLKSIENNGTAVEYRLLNIEVEKLSGAR
jgi:hypothetical protein